MPSWPRTSTVGVTSRRRRPWPGVPDQVVPRLLPQVRPIHEYVLADVYLQGCPPPADVIYGLLTDLVAGPHAGFDVADPFRR